MLNIFYKAKHKCPFIGAHTMVGKVYDAYDRRSLLNPRFFRHLQYHKYSCDIRHVSLRSGKSTRSCLITSFPVVKNKATLNWTWTFEIKQSLVTPACAQVVTWPRVCGHSCILGLCNRMVIGVGFFFFFLGCTK